MSISENKYYALNHGDQNEEYATSYHIRRRVQRKPFSEELLKALGKKSKNMNFLSVGCGFAGEESLLVPHFKKIVLLEQYERTVEFVKKIYNRFKLDKKNVEFVHDSIENYIPRCKFDIIYCSSVSNWMYDVDVGKIPTVYIDFCKKYLRDGGFLIARLYGPKTYKNIKNRDLGKDYSDILESNGFEMIRWDINKSVPESNSIVFGKKGKLPKYPIPFLDKGVENIFHELKNWKEEVKKEYESKQ